jgi:regulator of protease activity HflC (stomatin/prohibitin superfamily)
MHPPVPVAQAYEAVVSAQINRQTAIVSGQVYRNQVLPAAQDSVLRATNAARAAGLDDLGVAAGEAWAFRAVERQFRSAPAEYFFRRRLETLEQRLAGHPFTIVDERFLRDGGELWLTP